MRSPSLLALAASISSAAAVFQGFNYGSTFTDGSFKQQSDFQSDFHTAKNLVGTSGFTSARLYTMIQGGSSTNQPTTAIPAAIAENVSLLLGLWASGGQGGMDAEITALKSAIAQYGTAFTSLVAGISVGSEDLYRISPTGIAAKSGYGANPDTLVSYIGQVRAAIAGTPLSGAGVGHVDTWTAWVNGSNNAVSQACDWIGMDAYPYFQNTMANSIDTGAQLFNDAFSATQAAVGGKPVWITETGWPVSGSTENQAVPSTANAKTYWDQVGCPNFGKVNTWWFTLQDGAPTTPNPSFGIVGSTLSTTPLYDLSCSAVASSSSSPGPSSSSPPASGSASGSAPQSSSAATGSPLASSGGGLSPSEGAGNGVGPASSSGAAPTGSSSGSGASGNSSTYVASTAKPTGSGSTSASPSSTGPISVPSNAAGLVQGSLMGVMGIAFAAVAAL